MTQRWNQRAKPLRRNDDWHDLGRWLRSPAYDIGDDAGIDATLKRLEREERANGT